MKNKLLIAIVALAMGVAVKSSANSVYISQVTGYYQTDGEFNVSPVIGVGYTASAEYNNTLGALGFGTFCIDRGANIVVPGTYNATVYANEIDPFSGAHLTEGAAWLYSQFATGGNFGGFATYNYTPGGVYTVPGSGRVYSAYELQLAIWVLQNQYPLSGISPGSDAFITAIIDKYGSVAAAQGNATSGEYNVGVLGFDIAGAQYQPMLTLLPDGGATVMLLGMALSGLALISRKVRAARA